MGWQSCGVHLGPPSLIVIVLMSSLLALASAATTLEEPKKSDGTAAKDATPNAKYSRKTEESIIAKACRPSILAKNPSFGIEHVRDTFRFKGVVYSFRDALTFVFAMDKSKHLCPNGLCEDNVAKLDIQKLMKPKEWGWRFLAFDFIMPNHQLVEVCVRGLV